MLSFVKDTTGAHQLSKNAFEHVLAESTLLVARAKMYSKVPLLFARLVCATHIFNKTKHVRACFSKSAFAKSSFSRLVCARPKGTKLFRNDVQTVCCRICIVISVSVMTCHWELVLVRRHRVETQASVCITVADSQRGPGQG